MPASHKPGKYITKSTPLQLVWYYYGNRFLVGASESLGPLEFSGLDFESCHCMVCVAMYLSECMFYSLSLLLNWKLSESRNYHRYSVKMNS